MEKDKRWNVFLTQPSTLEPEGRRLLEGFGLVRDNPTGHPLNEDEMIRFASDADAMVSTFAEPYKVFSRRVIAAARNLKVIGWLGISAEHIDVDAATERGIYITYNDIQCPSVSDIAMGLLICAARRIIPAYEAVREGGWEREGYFFLMNFMGQRVHNKTLGIVGLGRTGSGVAKRAKGFDMKILYYDLVRRKDLEEELGIIPVSFESLVRESDFISCHLPLTDRTRNLFGAKEFAMMKRTCIFVNCGRGACVDTAALYEALRVKQIEIAALDVIEPEPLPSNHPILKLDNLILVPHIAGLARETRVEQSVEVAQETHRVLRGYRPKKLMNLEVLKVRPLPPEPGV